MASGLVLLNGSPLIGSPITYRVTAANITGVCSFHAVKLTVSAALSDGGSGWIDLTLSSPAESGETLTFDVSSALRAVADRYEYSAEPPTEYPYISYKLSACDEYMQNGEVHDNVGTVSTTAGRVLMGAFSDFERLLSGGNKLAQHFSRKPSSSPEVVMVGETMVCPQSFSSPLSEANISRGPVSKVVNITKDGMQTINGRQVYAIPNGQVDRYQFRFVNSLGCLESVSVTSFRTTEMNVTSDSYIRSITESFGTLSRSIVSKKNDYETWKLSSGPLDRSWQSWFMHEFIMADIVWINLEGSWIPCHIIPDETVAGLDRVQNNLLEVVFGVRLDINGSPLKTLII